MSLAKQRREFDIDDDRWSSANGKGETYDVMSKCDFTFQVKTSRVTNRESNNSSIETLQITLQNIRTSIIAAFSRMNGAEIFLLSYRK